MICVFVTPFINGISFDIAEGQSCPLHRHSEELMSWIQHLYDLKFILKFMGFHSVSIEVIYMAVYFSGQIMALIISFKVISVSIVISSGRHIQWSSW